MKSYNVNLIFFQDDANGDFGLTHDNTIDPDNGFNAFWNGIGIFHDVFEHYFEGKNKYFQGDNFLNVGGEMAAMGHAMAYYENIGQHRQFGNSWSNFMDTCTNETISMVHEAINDGYIRFGSTLESGVPYQKPVYIYGSDFETVINYNYDNQLKPLKTRTPEAEYNDDLQNALMYQKSLKKSKFINLYRYGYKQAYKIMAGDEDFNKNVLREFIEFFDKFTKILNAEELTGMFESIDFNITKVNGKLRWSAELISNYPEEIENFKFNSKKLPHIDSEMFLPKFEDVQ